MRKTYTIYIDSRSPIDLQNLTKGRAEGAMLVFKMMYKNNSVTCICDQTKETLDAIIPRKINVNKKPPKGWTYDKRGGYRQLGVYDG